MRLAGDRRAGSGAVECAEPERRRHSEVDAARERQTLPLDGREDGEGESYESGDGHGSFLAEPTIHLRGTRVHPQFGLTARAKYASERGSVGAGVAPSECPTGQVPIANIASRSWRE